MKIQHGLAVGAILSSTMAAPFLHQQRDRGARLDVARELSPSPPIHMPSCANSNSIPKGFKCIDPPSTVRSGHDPADATAVAAPATPLHY